MPTCKIGRKLILRDIYTTQYTIQNVAIARKRNLKSYDILLSSHFEAFM